MAYTPIDFVNEVTELDEDNMNHLEDGVKKSYNVSLIAISSTAPSEYSVGDKYFNTTTNLIYTATATGWGETGETPISDIFYIVFSTTCIYAYNGTTLIRVGGNPNSIEAPIGGEIDYVGVVDPLDTRWLIEDGRELSRAEYAELFEIIGTTFGVGDGVTTFNIPKIEGLVTVGLKTTDTDFDEIGKTGGGKGSYLPIQLSNSGFLDVHKTTLTKGYPNWENYRINYTGSEATLSNESAWGTAMECVNNASGVSGNGNLQPYTVRNKIIRVK